MGKCLPLVLHLFVCLGMAAGVRAQAVPDTLFPIQDQHPWRGRIYRVAIDEAHQNYHTASGRFLPFAKAVRAHGMNLRPFRDVFSSQTLAQTDILVISNALHPSNANAWQEPVLSAFTAEEIQALKSWVQNGGSLWLIADHMPFANAAQALAAAFGVEYAGCFAMDNRRRNVETFTKQNGGLETKHLTGLSTLDSVVSFTGSAIQSHPNLLPILYLHNYTLLEPQVAWQFTDDTPACPSDGWLQLALMEFGRGRIVFAGEAAMFSAQISGGGRAGFNHPNAHDNLQLIYLLLDWLANEKG